MLYEGLVGPAPDGPRHSTALLGEVERAAEAAGGWGEVGTIAVGRGPGSFVGIRIGLATAHGLATSTGLPLAGVCTLDALGRAMGAATADSEPTTHSAVPFPQYLGKRNSGRLAVLDARRGEVFAALYSAAGERLWEPFVASPEGLCERLGELPAMPWAAGPGAVRFRHVLASRGVDVPGDGDPLHRVAARHVCALATTAGERDGGRLDPIYLRAPDAQRWRERDGDRTSE